MKITLYVVCGLAVLALGGCAYKPLSAPCSMDEDGGPAKSAQVEAAPVYRPSQPSTRSRRFPTRERNRRVRLGRSRALGQGIAGPCARSTRERCDDRSANCTASNYGTGLIPTLLSGVDQTGCNYVQGAYQELARDLTAGGAGASIASLLLILYVIFWAFAFGREPRPARPPMPRSDCFARL